MDYYRIIYLIINWGLAIAHVVGNIALWYYLVFTITFSWIMFCLCAFSSFWSYMFIKHALFK